MFLTKNAHLYQRPKRQSTLTADEASAVSELSKNEEAATITSPGPDFQIEEDLDNGLDNNSDDNNRQNKDNKSVLQRIVLTRLPEILRMKSPTDTESVMPIAITESDLKQFRELKFNTYDKKRFLSLWMEMVDGSYNSNNTKNKLPIKSGMRTNATVHPPATTSVPAPSSTSNGTKVSFHNFITYFRLNNDNISKRLFDLINQSLTGKASLLEFLQFCNSYLIIDKDTTEEFCFRIISRRGNNFNAKYSIIDLQDMENFVTVRYSVIRNNSRSNSNNNSIAKGESSIANINDDVDEDIVIMTLPVIKKKALSIFTHIDNDGDGGIDINEFHEFCRENPVFMKFSHPLQNHLRKCIFGIDFWVVKSRKIKKSKAGGLDSLTLLSRINVESERYTLRHIRDPVIDKIDNPLKVPPYVPPGFVISPTPQGKFLRGNTKRTLPRGSTNASAASTNSNNSRPVMEKTMSIAAFASEINKQREIDEISALSGEFGRLESLFISDDPDDVLDEKATATKPPLNRGMTQSRPMSGITAASRQTSSASIGPGRLSRTASRMSLVRKDANKEETPREPTPEELIEDNDKRKFISWRGPFTITE